MGERGKPPEPTALAVLKGKKPPAGEPVPSAGDIRCPSDLSAGAKAVWRRLAPDLMRKGVLTPWDVDHFAAFCDAVDRHDRAAEHLNAEGEVVEQPVFDRNGKPSVVPVQRGRKVVEVAAVRLVQNPWWQIWKGANEAMLRYGARFGLSPSDRSQLSVKVDQPGGTSSPGGSGSRLLTGG